MTDDEIKQRKIALLNQAVMLEERRQVDMSELIKRITIEFTDDLNVKYEGITGIIEALGLLRLTESQIIHYSNEAIEALALEEN